MATRRRLTLWLSQATTESCPWPAAFLPSCDMTDVGLLATALVWDRSAADGLTSATLSPACAAFGCAYPAGLQSAYCR